MDSVSMYEFCVNIHWFAGFIQQSPSGNQGYIPSGLRPQCCDGRGTAADGCCSLTTVVLHRVHGVLS